MGWRRFSWWPIAAAALYPSHTAAAHFVTHGCVPPCHFLYTVVWVGLRDTTFFGTRHRRSSNPLVQAAKSEAAERVTGPTFDQPNKTLPSLHPPSLQCTHHIPAHRPALARPPRVRLRSAWRCPPYLPSNHCLHCTHHRRFLSLPLPCQAAKSEAAERVAVPTFDPEEIAQMEVLWEKIRLQLAFAS